MDQSLEMRLVSDPEIGIESSCSICTSESVNMQRLSCNHQFCYSCISRWLVYNNNCAICGVKASTSDLKLRSNQTSSNLKTHFGKHIAKYVVLTICLLFLIFVAASLFIKNNVNFDHFM